MEGQGCAQTEAGDASSADWRELPPELLHRVFAAVFPLPDQPAPLLNLFQQHASLQLTCKAWAAALEHTHYEVSVETCLPPRGSHAWLQRHAAALYFEAPVSSEADYTSPLPQATFGVIHRRIRNEDAAGTCAANLRWLRRLNGAPKPHGYWVAGPQPPSAAPADDILEWAMDMHDSCRLGHDSLMALLSQRVRSMQEMSRQYDCTDPEMAQIVFPIAKLVPIRRMLPACRSLRTLCLDYHPFARNYIHSFDARAVVAKLTQLETLALIGWGGFDLDSLPRSLRTLVVRGFGFPVCEMEGPVLSSASEFNIPEECRLESAAVVGYRTGLLPDLARWEPEEDEAMEGFEVDLPRMWRSCRELLVDAEVLCLEGTCWGTPVLTSDARPVLQALRDAMSDAAPLRRLLIHPHAYWVWNRPQPDSSDEEGAAAAPAAGEAAAEEEQAQPSFWGLRPESPPCFFDAYHAAGLAKLPAELLRQYGLAVRKLRPTRPQGSSAIRTCCRLSDLLAYGSPLPGRFDQEYEFRRLLEITPADPAA